MMEAGGKTQSEVAEFFNVHRSTISWLESERWVLERRTAARAHLLIACLASCSNPGATLRLIDIFHGERPRTEAIPVASPVPAAGRSPLVLLRFRHDAAFSLPLPPYSFSNRSRKLET
jgi:hypothetical protein